jgi:hypothetical protein
MTTIPNDIRERNAAIQRARTYARQGNSDEAECWAKIANQILPGSFDADRLLAQLDRLLAKANREAK